MSGYIVAFDYVNRGLLYQSPDQGKVEGRVEDARVFTDFEEAVVSACEPTSRPCHGAYTLRIGPRVCAEWPGPHGIERVVYATVQGHPAFEGYGLPPA